LYLPEALVLANVLNKEQYVRVYEHAQRVLAYANDTPNYLEGFRYSEIGWCPFLDTEHGACTIYPYRPANCRHVYSNMPSRYCQTGIERYFEQHPEHYEEFLNQLDPNINEEGLPYIEPLQDIFYGKYEFYLTVLAAKYCNFSLYGEMSWLITLARGYDLWGMVTASGVTLSDFRQNIRNTGWYHDNVLTDCQEILPELKAQSVDLDFA
jgi:Fe-S-cluster containining protein